MKIAASSVDDYLTRVPAEHRAALTRVREVMRASLPAGYEEGLLYGMPSWYVPPERLAATYNGQPLAIASLASQKGYMALYLMNVYADPELERWFTSAFAAAGKKLDMGKSCVRFRTLDELPLDVVAEVARRTPVDAHIAGYLAAQDGRKQKPVVLPGRAAPPVAVPAAGAAKGKAAPAAKSKAKAAPAAKSKAKAAPAAKAKAKAAPAAKPKSKATTRSKVR